MPARCCVSAVCCLTLLLILLSGAQSKRLPWWSIRIAQEQGPHACVVESVPGTYLELWTECRYWTHRKICGQKTLIRYECCEGYQQLGEDNGCTAVKPLKNILDTAADLGARRFVAAVRESGLSDLLDADGAFTLFAPTDHAFDMLRMSPSLRAALEGGGDARNAVLLYHLLDGKLTSKEMRADQLVTTRSAGARLRLNRYSNQMRTANCHLLLRKDQQATNGIVHVIDGVLDPSSLQRTSAVDLVTQDGRFAVLSDALLRSGLAHELRRDMTQPMTLLAPSDEAFQQLPRGQMDAILRDRDALRALLENHVIQHPICRSAILDEHKLKSMAGNRLVFECDRDKVFIERSQVSGDEMLAEDGVVHVLDEVIMPDRARSVLELAERQESHLESFLSLVKVAGLEERLTNAGDVTLFAPTDAAFRAMPAEWWKSTRSDSEAARRLLLFHAAQGRRLSRDIADNQVVTALDGSGALRLQVHRGALGVENAAITQSDLEGRNGVLHVIDRVLTPATMSAGDILRQRGGFSTFLRVMEAAMAEGGSGLALHERGAATFFVPTDEAFSALGRRRMARLTEDVTMLTQTVKHHIAPRLLPSGSFQANLTYHIATMHGMVDVRRDGQQWTVGNARVLDSDIMNTNGVIHVIDRVLLPRRVRSAYFLHGAHETQDTRGRHWHGGKDSNHATSGVSESHYRFQFRNFSQRAETSHWTQTSN